jgi:16S rRNA G966 N2-methylase RsmD
VAAEYDFNIAATKSDVFKFGKKRHFDVISADPPYALEPHLKNCFTYFRKKHT